jgi:hypothetical protein
MIMLQAGIEGTKPNGLTFNLTRLGEAIRAHGFIGRDVESRGKGTTEKA